MSDMTSIVQKMFITVIELKRNIFERFMVYLYGISESILFNTNCYPSFNDKVFVQQ